MQHFFASKIAEFLRFLGDGIDQRMKCGDGRAFRSSGALHHHLRQHAQMNGGRLDVQMVNRLHTAQ